MALDYAIKQKLESVLILEDDASFIKDPDQLNNHIKSFFAVFNNDWDVFHLGTKVLVYENVDSKKFIKVKMSRCAHAYAVNGFYLKKLKAYFLKAYRSVENDTFGFQSNSRAIDVIWGILQEEDRWYSGKELFIHQKKLHSDISNQIYEHPNMGITKHSLTLIELNHKLKSSKLIKDTTSLKDINQHLRKQIS